MAIPVVARFFSQARDIALGQASDFNFDPVELLEIVDRPSAQASFEHELRSLNDPELVGRIKVYIRRFAETLEREESRINRRAKWYSGAATQVARGLAIAGGAAIFAMLAAGSTVVPGAILFCCGLAGMIISIGVENRIEMRADDLKFKAKRLRELIQ